MALRSSFAASAALGRGATSPGSDARAMPPAWMQAPVCGDSLSDPCLLQGAMPVTARGAVFVNHLVIQEVCCPMDVWPRCLERLEAEFPAEDVHTWLKPLQASHRDDVTVLYAPNAFVVEHVRERYLVRIRELLAYFAGSPEVSLEIGSLPRAAAPVREADANTASHAARGLPVA